MTLLEAKEDDGEKENNWYNWIELIRLHKMNQRIAMGNKPVAPMQMLRIGEVDAGGLTLFKRQFPLGRHTEEVGIGGPCL